MARPAALPVIGTSRFRGPDTDREAFPAQLPSSAYEVDFIRITGHGVPTALRAEVLSAAHAFFASPRRSPRAPLRRSYDASCGGSCGGVPQMTRRIAAAVRLSAVSAVHPRVAPGPPGGDAPRAGDAPVW
ncbi:2-oxoglutarate and iron-dependent oxygenase domain-containing protein [Streptomyces caelestis]|uniref:2-oxoglutarate and iron-dependent oxygenase domain-containing protein n=1 Tax=Streptomyces caelestis TaxID=36816 RepID=UPI00364AE184